MNKELKIGLISSYLTIGLLFAIYQYFWGAQNYESFAFQLGRGLVWPAVIFPVIGKIIGGILLSIFVLYLILTSRR